MQSFCLSNFSCVPKLCGFVSLVVCMHWRSTCSSCFLLEVFILELNSCCCLAMKNGIILYIYIHIICVYIYICNLDHRFFEIIKHEIFPTNFEFRFCYDLEVNEIPEGTKNIQGFILKLILFLSLQRWKNGGQTDGTLVWWEKVSKTGHVLSRESYTI